MRPAALLLVGAIAAACGSAAPSGTAPATSPDGSAVLDPSVVGVTCGDGIVFHPSLLDQAGRAEIDPDPAAAALRAHLASPEGEGAPSSSWVRVAQSADKVQFVARYPDRDGWAVVGFFVHDGAWSLDLAGDCSPEVHLPAGVSRAGWRLDGTFPPPGPADRTIHVVIHELACASGRSPEGRVLPPVVATTADRVTIAILVRSVEGNAECPGNPDFPMVVALPEPLGDRELFDGAVFPPAGPIAAFDLSCGTVDQVTCEKRAAEIVQEAARDQPDRTVVSIEILDRLGSYSVLFDDGTGATLIVN